MPNSPDDILQDSVTAILRLRLHNPEAPATVIQDDETVHELQPNVDDNKGTVETSGLLPGIQLEPPSLGYDRCTATCDNSEIHVVQPVSTKDRLVVQINECTYSPRRHSLTRSPTFYIDERDKGQLAHQRPPMDEPYESLTSDDASDAKDGSFVFSTPRSSVYPSDIDSSPYLAATAQDRDADVRGVGGVLAEDSYHYEPANDSIDDSPDGDPNAARLYTSNLGLPDQLQRSHASVLSVISDAGDQQHKRQHHLISERDERSRTLERIESFPVSSRHKLQNSIYAALVPVRNHLLHPGFLPKEQLCNLINPESVFGELTKGCNYYEVVKRRDSFERLASEVCEETEVEHGSRRKIKSFRKIFALLVLLEVPSLISRFVRNGVSDLDLPLVKFFGIQNGMELRRRDSFGRPSSQPLKCFKHDQWSPAKLINFERDQWMMLAPFFSRGKCGDVKHYPLKDQHILPFISSENSENEDVECAGGFGRVFMVRIHHEHHNFQEMFSCNRGFAIKQLYESDRAAFMKEVNILKKFSGDRGHPHVVSLLATYEQFKKYHLVFYRAEGDLFKYWKQLARHPGCQYDSVLWMAKQCAGIADGLLRLHRHLTFRHKTSFIETEEDVAHRSSATRHVKFQNPQVERTASGDSIRPRSPSWMHDPHQANLESLSNPGQKSCGEDQVEEEKYGRHGDINPGNILWYHDSSHPEGVLSGTLKISDFGQAELNSRLSKSKPRSVANTLTYRPPECDLKPHVIRQSYDIWCLGCVYLEFVTWMLGGYQLVAEFARRRKSRDRFQFGQITDTFFEVEKHEENANQAKVRVKPVVAEFINELHEHRNCTNFFHEILNLIQNEMIVVDSNARMSCQDVWQKLASFHRKCETDRSYAEDPRTWSESSVTTKPFTRSVDIVVEGEAQKIIADNDWSPSPGDSLSTQESDGSC